LPAVSWRGRRLCTEDLSESLSVIFMGDFTFPYGAARPGMKRVNPWGGL
jgi:hypothetical protein